MLEDISALKKLYNLEHLDLSDNLITDINVLQSLTKLKYLSLELNEISDISSLKNCRDLEVLNLNANCITNISSLTNLPKLEELQIESECEKNYTENDAELISWRNTLLSLPSLKYYVGGPYVRDGEEDLDWISKYLPNVKYGYRDIVEWSEYIEKRN